MAIAFVASSQATSGALALPTGAAAGMCLIVAASTTTSGGVLPTLDSDFTLIDNMSSSTAQRATIGYRVLDGSETDAGTWTNATRMIGLLYSGTDTTDPIGSSAKYSAVTATLNLPALTPGITDNTAWWVGFCAHRGTGTGAALNLPTGTTRETFASSNALIGGDSNATFTSFAGASVATGSSNQAVSITIELIAAAAGGTITGTGAATTPAATASGTAERTVTGSGAATAPAATASGSGAVGNAITGSGAATAPAATAAGTATRTITGAGAANAPVVTASGTAERQITGTGSATITPITANGTATRTITGSGAAIIAMPTAAGTGTVAAPGAVAGSGAATTPAATASGSGTVISLVTVTERQPGGYLPVIYVDEHGKPVDLNAAAERTIKAAPKQERKAVRKAVNTVTRAINETDVMLMVSEAFAADMALMLAHMQRLDALMAQAIEAQIEAALRAADDEIALSLLMVA